MCKFIGKSNEWVFCKLSKSEILRLYSIVHVAMETTKMSNFTSQAKSFISVFFTCQVSACELQPFSRHDLANDVYSQTTKTVFSHLKITYLQFFTFSWKMPVFFLSFSFPIITPLFEISLFEWLPKVKQRGINSLRIVHKDTPYKDLAVIWVVILENQSSN